MADFQFFLNRQGPRGPQGYKGDKGDVGKTPVPRTGTNTPIETTVIFDTGDGNPYETPNLKYPIEDRGGNMVMLDRANETQYYGTPDQATDNSYGVVKLATPESVLDDPLDSDVVTYELFDDNNQAIKTVTDGLTGDITQLNTDLGTEVTNRTNADTQLTNKINTDVGNEATARNNADTALSGRIDNLTTSKANKSDVYTKTQTDSLLNNKSDVGHTHNYNDLTNKPSIGNGTITFKQGGVTKGTITTNQSGDATIAFDAGGGSSFTAGTGLELTAQDVLNVKIDGSTITTNSSGQLVASSGTTYTEGAGIDITSDVISVNYDSAKGLVTDGTTGALSVRVDGSTIDFDNSGNLVVNLPTPETVDQVFDATSSHAQSGVAIAGAGYMNGSIVQSPLEYLPDTTNSIRTYHLNNMIGTTIGGGESLSVSTWGDTEPHVDIELLNGINLYTKNWILTDHYSNNPPYTTHSVKFGYYDNNDEFVSVAAFIPTSGYSSAKLWFYDSTQSIGYYEYQLSNYNINNTSTPYVFISYDPTSCLFGYVSSNTGSGHYYGGRATLTREQDIEALALCTTCRFTIATNRVGDTVNYSTITVSNPSITNYPFYSHCNKSNDADSFLDGYIASNPDSIFNVHPESLSLQYGSDFTVTGGKLALANPVDTSNMVTTNTNQDITGKKTFIGDQKFKCYYSLGGSLGLDVNYPQFDSNYWVGIRGNNNYNYSSIYLGNNQVVLAGNSVNDVKVRASGTSYTIVNAGNIDGSTIVYNSDTGKFTAVASGSSITKKTITQASANVSESSGTVTVTDADVTTSTLVNLYPSDTSTETWLENNLASTIITEGSGSFTFTISGSLPSTYSMYYTIQEVS